MAKEIRNLAVDLTTDEIHQRAMRLASLDQRLEVLETELSTAKKVATRKIKELKDEHRVLVDVVTKGREMREVECMHVLKPEQKLVEIIRTDTNVVIDTRAIEESDSQLDAFPAEQELPAASSKRTNGSPKEG